MIACSLWDSPRKWKGFIGLIYILYRLANKWNHHWGGFNPQSLLDRSEQTKESKIGSNDCVRQSNNSYILSSNDPGFYKSVLLFCVRSWSIWLGRVLFWIDLLSKNDRVLPSQYYLPIHSSVSDTNIWKSGAQKIRKSSIPFLSQHLGIMVGVYLIGLKKTK